MLMLFVGCCSRSTYSRQYFDVVYVRRQVDGQRWQEGVISSVENTNDQHQAMPTSQHEAPPTILGVITPIPPAVQDKIIIYCCDLIVIELYFCRTASYCSS